MLALFSLAAAFVVHPHANVRAPQLRAAVSTMIDIPRITLPDQVTSVLRDADLKNPNDMSNAEYNSYSAAAITGTLVLFVFPGSLVFDVTGFFKDFAFAALLGGGLAAYLSLRKDAAGDAANKVGTSLLDVVDKLADKIK